MRLADCSWISINYSVDMMFEAAVTDSARQVCSAAPSPIHRHNTALWRFFTGHVKKTKFKLNLFYSCGPNAADLAGRLQCPFSEHCISPAHTCQISAFFWLLPWQTRLVAISFCILESPGLLVLPQEVNFSIWGSFSPLHIKSSHWQGMNERQESVTTEITAE